MNKIWNSIKSIGMCKITSFLWLIFVTAYCIPYNSYNPVEEYRFPSPSGLFEAVVAYDAWGGAAGEWNNTLYLVPKNKKLVILAWWKYLFDDTPMERFLETSLDFPVSVLSGRIISPSMAKTHFLNGSYSRPDVFWISNNVIKISYCGYFYYYSNYGDIYLDGKKIRIYVDVEDMCDHDSRRKVSLDEVLQTVEQSSESSSTPIKEDS